MEKSVIAIAGSTDTAKYFIEQLEKSDRYAAVLLVRRAAPILRSLPIHAHLTILNASSTQAWFTRPSVTIFTTDYSTPSLGLTAHNP